MTQPDDTKSSSSSADERAALIHAGAKTPIEHNNALSVAMYNSFLAGLAYRDREIETLEESVRFYRREFESATERAQYAMELTEENNKLRTMLKKAYTYLKQGKAAFMPHTTNSFVDEWLSDYEVMESK